MSSDITVNIKVNIDIDEESIEALQDKLKALLLNIIKEEAFEEGGARYEY